MTYKRHTYPEAAEILRVPEPWLRRHIKELPHSKKGREVTFSDADLDAIDAMFHHTPASAVPAQPAQTTAPTTAPHPLATLRPLPARGALRVAR